MSPAIGKVSQSILFLAIGKVTGVGRTHANEYHNERRELFYSIEYSLYNAFVDMATMSCEMWTEEKIGLRTADLGVCDSDDCNESHERHHVSC